MWSLQAWATMENIEMTIDDDVASSVGWGHHEFEMKEK